MMEPVGSAHGDGPWAGADRVDVAEARRWILDRVRSLEPRPVPLADALGLVLARTAEAAEPSPGFDTAAMDGFAIGTSGPAVTSFAVVGTSAAGRPYAGAVRSGEAVRIMTGALVPEGAETVVPLEHTSTSADRVAVPADRRRGANIRRVGEDHRPGDIVVERGVRLRPVHIALLAGIGHVRPTAVPRVRVGVLSTGDELGGDASSAGIRDANRPGLLALVAQDGHAGVDLGSVADDARLLERRILAALDHCDAILTSGGVSVGDHDAVKHVLARLAAGTGGDARWMHVAVRPAKPLTVAIIGGVPVLGLPGNPASAFVSYELFARPSLDRLAGRAPADEFDAVASMPFERAPDGRLHVVPSIVSVSAAGALTVRPAGGSRHGLKSAAAANAYTYVADGDGVAIGETARSTWMAPAGPATWADSRQTEPVASGGP